MGHEVEILIKFTLLLRAKTHFRENPEATQSLNEVRDGHPIVTTKGAAALTVLAGILRSLTVRRIAITGNELGIEPNDLRRTKNQTWKRNSDRLQSGYSPKHQETILG